MLCGMCILCDVCVLSGVCCCCLNMCEFVDCDLLCDVVWFVVVFFACARAVRFVVCVPVLLYGLWLLCVSFVVYCKTLYVLFVCAFRACGFVLMCLRIIFATYCVMLCGMCILCVVCVLSVVCCCCLNMCVFGVCVCRCVVEVYLRLIV